MVEKKYNFSKNETISTNYENLIGELVDVYSEVLGIEYKSLISDRLNKIKIINYFTDKHLENYLNHRGIDYKPNDNGNDNILREYANKMVNSISKQYPTVEIFKYLDYFPISSYSIYNMFGEFDYKECVLRNLNLIKPENGFAFFSDSKKREYKNYIEQTWDKYFSNIELITIIEISKKFYNEYSKDILAKEGNINECVTVANKIDPSLGNVFLNMIVKNSRMKCMESHFVKNTNEIIPVVINPICFLYNSEMLISIIHEITHGLSLQKIKEDKNGILYKSGLRSCLRSNNKEEMINDYNYLNESITQYIAAEVTQKLIEKNFVKRFFNFDVPVQEANLYSSYTNCLLFGKDFIEQNRKELFAAYIDNNQYQKLLGIMDFKKIEDYFFKAYYTKNELEVEELKSKSK